MSNTKKHHSNKSPKGGFSIIELLVAVAVMVTLSSVLLFNYNSMNVRITLDMLAHQTAQWVRETQVLAMSVKQTSLNTFPGYGLHFDRATPDQFVFFADFDGQKDYTPIPSGKKCGDSGVECQQIVKLLKGNMITKLCSTATAPSAPDCGTYAYASVLDVVFTRPDPDANIKAKDSLNTVTDVSSARITITTPTKYQRTVEIWTTGQVSVQ